jgi:hypothetical protein
MRYPQENYLQIRNYLQLIVRLTAKTPDKLMVSLTTLITPFIDEFVIDIFLLLTFNNPMTSMLLIEVYWLPGVVYKEIMRSPLIVAFDADTLLAYSPTLPK